MRIPKHHARETAENTSNITQHRTRLANSPTCRELGKGHLLEPRKLGYNRHLGDASWIRPLARGGHLQIHNWPFVILSKTPCFQISFMEEAPVIDTEIGQSQTHKWVGLYEQERCVLTEEHWTSYPDQDCKRTLTVAAWRTSSVEQFLSVLAGVKWPG